MSNHEPKHIPHIEIEHRLDEGIGTVEMTFSKPILETLLGRLGLRGVNELSDHDLRQLVQKFSEAHMQAAADNLHAQEPGSVRITTDQDDINLGSDSLGYDMAKRFLVTPDENRALAFDPQYSPVRVEMNVFNPSELPKNSADTKKISARVLEVTLQPPSLA